jgi:hypothetical protein
VVVGNPSVGSQARPTALPVILFEARLGQMRCIFWLLCRYAAFNRLVADDMANSMTRGSRALGLPTTPGGHPLNMDFM